MLWPTDHDWRMTAFKAPTTFHTSGLTETVNGQRYAWVSQPSGALASATAAAVSSPSSPADPTVKKGALRLSATSSDVLPASSRLYLNAAAANQAHRTNLAGQVLRLQVLLTAAGPDAWGELLLTLSHHPATATRPAGRYQVSYRFAPTAAPTTTDGLLAVVTVPVPLGTWTEVVLEPAVDVAAAWPDAVAQDNALTDLWLGATSRAQHRADVCFGYLRFARTRTAGNAPLATQDGLFAAYAGAYPEVAVRRGVEVSVASTHVNWFGGTPDLIDYTSAEGATWVRASPAAYTSHAVSLIHAAGGLASLNHPFGSENGLRAQADQDAERRTIAAARLVDRAHGVDVLEVGYRQRGGASLASHLALWDTLSRAGIWLTGNGVNDAHGGTTTTWRALTNRFVTTVLAASTRESDLLAALAAGRTYVSELGSFTGLLEVEVEGAPMGSVSLRPDLRTRVLTLRATGLPKGSVVRVVQGAVDHGRSVDPSSAVVRTVPAAQLVSRVESDLAVRG